jgi:pilus assembly protein Flp/PilA
MMLERTMESGSERLVRPYLKKFLRDEAGATSIEYSLIAIFIFIVIIVSVKAVGTKLSPIFNKVSGNL